MADQAKEKMEDVRTYASRHPRRMNGGAILFGTLLGASLATVKANKNKSPMQKFIDKMSK
jgi:hypothetical protein